MSKHNMQDCYANKLYDRKFCTYYNVSSIFNDEEIETIKTIGNNLTTNRAATFGGHSNDSIRRGSVAWLPRTEVSNQGIYSRLLDKIKAANNELWGFDVIGFWEDCQYTTYDGDAEKGDHYGYHLDIDGEAGAQRKISIVVQLTDPSEYEGGDLEILTTERPFFAPKAKGSALLFPSFCLHKVHPVTKGKRNSLVLWASGTPYR